MRRFSKSYQPVKQLFAGEARAGRPSGSRCGAETSVSPDPLESFPLRNGAALVSAAIENRAAAMFGQRLASKGATNLQIII